MSKIFVTGGSGFVAQQLIARLSEHGHTVIALSRSGRSDDVLRRMDADPCAGAGMTGRAGAALLPGTRC